MLKALLHIAAALTCIAAGVWTYVGVYVLLHLS